MARRQTFFFIWILTEFVMVKFLDFSRDNQFNVNSQIIVFSGNFEQFSWLIPGHVINLGCQKSFFHIFFPKFSQAKNYLSLSCLALPFQITVSQFQNKSTFKNCFYRFILHQKLRKTHKIFQNRPICLWPLWGQSHNCCSIIPKIIQKKEKTGSYNLFFQKH